MLLNFLTNQAQRLEERRAKLLRALIHFEAKIGGQLFGPVPQGVRREFFCLDEHTWVWHEEWTDANGQRQVMTTRYDVRPSGVVKSQGHMSYQALTPQEEHNFYRAVDLYEQQVLPQLQRLAHSS